MSSSNANRNGDDGNVSVMSWSTIMTFTAWMMAFIFSPLFFGYSLRCVSDVNGRRGQTCSFEPHLLLLFLWISSLLCLAFLQRLTAFSCCFRGHGHRSRKPVSLHIGLRICLGVGSFITIFLGSFLGGVLWGTGVAPRVGSIFVGFAINGVMMLLTATIPSCAKCCMAWPCAAPDPHNEAAPTPPRPPPISPHYDPPLPAPPPSSNDQVLMERESSAAPFCSKCAVEVSPATARFCHNCGTAVTHQHRAAAADSADTFDDREPPPPSYDQIQHYIL